MPAVSQAQQALMGMAYAYKKGELKDVSEEVKKLADSMTLDQLHDFASTSHKGLPVHKEEYKPMKKKIKLSSLLESISKQTGKKVILKEYFVNEKSKINDVGGLNILNDMDDEMLEEIGIESQKLIKKYQPIAKKLAGELKPYMKKLIPSDFVKKIDDSWYDGSDAYDDQESQERYLPGIYDKQIKLLEKLVTALKG